jgi:hypothetical protein
MVAAVAAIACLNFMGIPFLLKIRPLAPPPAG